jgi:hypothetical protein
MRISIAIVIVMVMLLSACNAGSGRFQPDRGGSSMSTTPSSQLTLPVAANVDRGLEVTGPGYEDRELDPTGGGSGTGSTVPNTDGNAPAVTTTTTMAVVTVDQQDVESALAELDGLLGSLVSAISSMDQAFEQGE